MPEPNIGDRIMWVHNEPSAEHDEVHGEVTGLEIRYRVKWDNGEEELCDAGDITLDPEHM